MSNRLLGALPFILIGFVLPLVADQNPPVFFFGKRSLHIGMSKQEAVAQLSDCCELSPPADANIEDKPHPASILPGYFIKSKDIPVRMLGSISFSHGKVVRVSRPLDDEIDSSNDDLVGFVRALRNGLDPNVSGTERTVTVSVQHESTTNAASQIILLRFPNGRGIEIHVGTLDKAKPDTGKRDFATIDESLLSPN